MTDTIKSHSLAVSSIKPSVPVSMLNYSTQVGCCGAPAALRLVSTVYNYPNPRGHVFGRYLRGVLIELAFASPSNSSNTQYQFEHRAGNCGFRVCTVVLDRRWRHRTVTGYGPKLLMMYILVSRTLTTTLFGTSGCLTLSRQVKGDI